MMATMATLMLTSVAPVLLALAADEPWCGGVAPPQLGQDASVDVYFAQAPLFSTGSLAGLLKYFNLFHTATIFHETSSDQYWTLEFDMVMANSMIPFVNLLGGNGSEISWSRNEARWCLWSGIYNGLDHWKTFDNVATISGPQLNQLMTAFVLPLNGSLSNQYAYPTYNPFYVSDQQGGELLDMTCGTGTSWVFDFIHDQLGAPVQQFNASITRIKVNVSALEEVDVHNDEEWCKMLNYFDLQDEAVHGDHNITEAFSIIDGALPQRYAFDGNRNKYFKLIGDHHYFEVVHEEVRGGTPVPSYACKSDCAPPAPNRAVFCTTTTTTAPPSVPRSDQVCDWPGVCGTSYDLCCLGRAIAGQACQCHLQNAGNASGGKGGRAGEFCDTCGFAYAECCTANAIQGYPCGCDVERPASGLVVSI